MVCGIDASLVVYNMIVLHGGKCCKLKNSMHVWGWKCLSIFYTLEEWMGIISWLVWSSTFLLFHCYASPIWPVKRADFYKVNRVKQDPKCFLMNRYHKKFNYRVIPRKHLHMVWVDIRHLPNITYVIDLHVV